MGNTLISIAALFPWLLVAVGGWLVWNLIAQNGRIVLRLEAIEKQLSRELARTIEPDELPLGTSAPAFELDDLQGQRQSLASYLGRRLLLVFFHPHCGYCAELVPDLAAISPDGSADQPMPVIISDGTADEHRLLVAEHGLRCPILLAGGTDLAGQYRADGTPVGYLIDQQGRIASTKAVGRVAILALASGMAQSSKIEDRTDGIAGSGERLLESANSNADTADLDALPGLGRQAWNLAQAVADFAADGFTTISDEEYRQRLTACDGCHSRQGGRCMECGCHLRLKARGRAFDCPLGKWQSTTEGTRAIEVFS